MSKQNLKYVGSLHEAATNADVQAIRRLLDIGYNVNETMGTGGYALLNCIQFTHSYLFSRSWSTQELEKVKQHLRRGPQYRYATSEPALTSWHEQQCTNCTSELLNHGADIECRNTDGKTPLILASNCNQYTILELLLEKRANIDAQDKHCCTALYYADDCSKVILLCWSIKTRNRLSRTSFMFPQEMSDYVNEYEEGLEYQRLEALHDPLSLFPHVLQVLIKEYVLKVSS